MNKQMKIVYVSYETEVATKEDLNPLRRLAVKTNDSTAAIEKVINCLSVKNETDYEMIEGIETINIDGTEYLTVEVLDLGLDENLFRLYVEK